MKQLSTDQHRHDLSFMARQLLGLQRTLCAHLSGTTWYLQGMFPEEAQGVGEHFDGPDPPSVDRLQLRLHGQVLRDTQATAAEEQSIAEVVFLMLKEKLNSSYIYLFF